MVASRSLYLLLTLLLFGSALALPLPQAFATLRNNIQHHEDSAQESWKQYETAHKHVIDEYLHQDPHPDHTNAKNAANDDYLAYVSHAHQAIDKGSKKVTSIKKALPDPRKIY